MPDKITYAIPRLALGQSISFLSMLLNSTYNFHINVNISDHIIIQLKKIYNIPDSKLSISIVDHMPDSIIWEISDVGKLTSPYISPEFLNIRDQQVKVFSKLDKCCIALTCYTNFQDLEKYDSTDYNHPNNRYLSIEQYSRIFQLIKQSGYEVMTLDNVNISLEEKVYLLNEFCAAIIGYEGGLCHLAHTLNIPAIILPWKPYEAFFCGLDSLHIDRKTYFVRSIEEFNNWSKFDLLNILEQTNDGITNNIFYTGEVKFAKDFSDYKITADNKQYGIMSGMYKFEIDFWKNNFENLSIFDKPIQFYN